MECVENFNLKLPNLNVLAKIVQHRGALKGKFGFTRILFVKIIFGSHSEITSRKV